MSQNNNHLIHNREEFLHHILQWDPKLVLNDNESNSFSSDVIPLKLAPPPLVYDSIENFFKVQSSVLLHEFWYKLKRINEDSKHFKVRFFMKRNGESDAIPVNSTECFVYYQLHTALFMNDSDLINKFKFGSLVKFTNPSTNEEQFGFISWIKYNRRNEKIVVDVEMMVKFAQCELLIRDPIILELIWGINPYLNLVDGLMKFPKSPLCKAILNPNFHDYQFSLNYDIDSIKTNKFNAKQLEAAAKIVKTVEDNMQKICLLSGPPGTGKTQVIVHSILSMIRRKSTKNILVCAHSNIAIDSIVLQLMHEEPTLTDQDIVRVGNDENINELLKGISFSSLHKSQRTAKADHAGRLILQQAKVIAATLSSCHSYYMQRYFESLEIPVCIIDEAPQASELHLLLPLIHGIKTLILVGDSKQLLPKFYCQEIKKIGLDQSLFTRVESIFSMVEKSPVLTLDTQYRMTPSIAHWPNEFFYKGALKNYISQNSTSIFEYKVLNHHHIESDDKYTNNGEAQLVVNVCNTLMTQINLEEVDFKLTIGIITLTDQQKNLILELLEKRAENISIEYKRKIRVDIADGFQGLEFDIVILSLVHSSSDEFVNLPDRLCLSLTRAKKSLIICGNFEKYSDNFMWKNLLDDAKKRKVYVDVGLDNEPEILERYLIKHI